MKILNKTFSIRWKIVLIVLFSVVALILLVYVFSETIISKSYLKIEKDKLEQNIERVNDSVENISSELTVKLTDWAFWDDTYQYMIDKSSEYEESNLDNVAFLSLKINAMVFVDAQGEIIYKKMVDLNTVEEVSSENLASHILSNKKLTTHVENTSLAQGLIVLPEGAMFISSRPVLRTTGDGPIQGSLIFAKFIDQEMVDRIGQLTHLSLELYNISDTSIPEDVALVKSNLRGSGEKYYVNPLSKDSIAGYKILSDIYGDPVFILKINEPRQIYSQGKVTLFYFLTIASILFILFGFFIVLLFDKFIISRFFKLSKEIRHIGDTNNFKERVTEENDDEIGVLENSINKMLDALDSSQESEASSINELQVKDEKLNEKLKELEKVNSLMVNRELKMIELKDEIEKLKLKP